MAINGTQVIETERRDCRKLKEGTTSLEEFASKSSNQNKKFGGQILDRRPETLYLDLSQFSLPLHVILVALKRTMRKNVQLTEVKSYIAFEWQKENIFLFNMKK